MASKFRALAAAGVALLLSAGTVASAQAMGTGNGFLDMQGGVTYTVYSPTFTAGLNIASVGGNTATAPGIEQNLVAVYGKANGRNFTLYEGNPLGSDPGMATPILSTTVLGKAATVYAFCDPASTRRCKAADVSKVGGYLRVTLPAAKGLRPTVVVIETDGPKPIAAQQLVQIARGLQPLTQ